MHRGTGNTFGGDTVNGDTVGGDTVGGDTVGGDTMGADAVDGDIMSGVARGNSKTVYQKNSNIAWRNIADEAILVPMAKVPGEVDSAYVLNDTGARIWELLDGVATMEQIAEVISEEYDIDRAEAQVDLQEMLDQLVALKAVESVSQ